MIYTIGHSVHPQEWLLDTLKSFSVSVLADVRTIPKSRHNPQWAREAIEPAAERAGLLYTHIPSLGGLRKPRPDSINTAWRNASFRGYADHMQTDAFRAGLDALCVLAERGSVAIMCAEAVHWRCHRSLVADALLARGLEVQHITPAGKAQPHKLTPFARVDGERVTYPGVL
jgi:uncharacterized protein (DUF488 family)